MYVRNISNSVLYPSVYLPVCLSSLSVWHCCLYRCHTLSHFKGSKHVTACGSNRLIDRINLPTLTMTNHWQRNDLILCSKKLVTIFLVFEYPSWITVCFVPSKVVDSRELVVIWILDDVVVLVSMFAPPNQKKICPLFFMILILLVSCYNISV